MSIATGVVLFVIGAILAFAVDVQLDFISLSTVGYILMVGGAVVFVIALAFAIRGNRTVTSTRSAAGDQEVRRTASTSDDPTI